MASSSHRAESSPSSLRDGHNRPYDRHHLIANSSSSISIDSEEKWDDGRVYHGREKDDAIELEALNRRRDDENDDDDNDGAHDCTSSLSSPKALYTVHEEKAIVRKFDRHLVLLIALMYLLAFLDRSSMPGFSSVYFIILVSSIAAATILPTWLYRTQVIFV